MIPKAPYHGQRRRGEVGEVGGGRLRHAGSVARGTLPCMSSGRRVVTTSISRAAAPNMEIRGVEEGVLRGGGATRRWSRCFWLCMLNMGFGIWIGMKMRTSYVLDATIVCM